MPVRKRGGGESRALARLARLRAELLRELGELEAAGDYLKGQAADACCRRPLNRMRLTPLEARAIAQAFARDPRLRAKLGAVRARLQQELPRLRDNEERQSFDCPLLERGRCLVHREAKPIGCLAWHPAPPRAKSGRAHYTERGWRAFDERDALNDEVHGRRWKLRAIPLWLERVLSRA